MRFQRLHIPAFGPFTNLDVSFPSRGYDLHVVYGENEAGKSSLLRAIRDLLFGIDGQSPDNFLHEYKDFRLSGEIENRAGEQLKFQRRKGTKNTLLDQNGNPLPDKALLPFLGAIDKAYFSAMFGLGGRELREGAEQLLKGEGELGSSLFSASLGSTPIQRVLHALVAESEELFKGRATANVSIRPAVKRHKELLDQSREAIVKAETWDLLEKDLTQEETAKRTLEDEIAKFENEIAWVSRCEDALPSVGCLNEARRALGNLPNLPDVASDFVERARLARDAVSGSNVRVQALTQQITQLENRLANCVTSAEVLADAGALDVLHQDLGAYRQKKEALTKQREKLAGIEPALQAGMKSLEIPGEFESLETLRLGSAVQISCEEAANALQRVLSSRDENKENADKLNKEITSDEEELKLLPETDLAPLREALAEAAGAIDADKTLAVSQAVVEKLVIKVAAEKALVFGVPADLDVASMLSVPPLATIRKFRERFESLRGDIERAKKGIRDEEKKIRTFEDDLRRLERRGALPSEDSLKEAREHRDRGWRLVLMDWKGDGAKEELEPGAPLEETFPKTISRADKIADQLRLDAEAVAQAEEKRLQLRNSRETISLTNATLTSLQSLTEECKASWKAEWARIDIHPDSPDEMEEWRENWTQLRETFGKLREAEAVVRAKDTQLQHARKTLSIALMDSQAKPFSVLFEAARSRIQRGEESTGRRKEIKTRLERLRKELENFNRKSEGLLHAFDTAEANWRSRCQAAGLPDGTTPNSGLRLLQERKELLAKFDRWKELSVEADAMAEAIRRYEVSVSEKAVSLGIEGDSTETREARLCNALTQARTAQAEHDQLASQLQAGKDDLATAKQQEKVTSQSMEELLQLSQLSTQRELEPLLANLEERTRVQNQINSLMEALGGLARGQGVDDFISRVQAENADQLPQRKILLGNKKMEKVSTLRQVQTTLIQLNSEKEKLEKASDAAADFRQQAELVLASLKQDVSRFMRLRLAAYFLRNQIERFRKENQGPLLERSGQVFRQITRGAFDGLAAEFNDKDIPVMVGRRANGANVPVEGMSDGSRDQLYLALRLAAMDRYLEEHEPMPLILDDLLMTFDNERTKAILPQLADLSKRTQIFLFTHHVHLVELCRETVGEGRFEMHQLGTGDKMTLAPK